MTGIAGGTVDSETLDRMVEALHTEPWYRTDRFEVGEYGLGVQSHGDRDPAGGTVWHDGQTAGIVNGAVTNLDALGWDHQTLFERLLQAPERTLETIEGPFAIACVDGAADRLLLATDKIGCRPIYYATEHGLTFGSELGPFLEHFDDPEVDEQGVSDVLLMGHMWSDTTMLEDVSALHPATVLEYQDGAVTERRYWHPDFEPAAPNDAYLHRLTNSFQQAMDRTATATSGDVGLWLSGGLDSRIAFSELARNHEENFDSLTAYTYDANPGGGINPKLAGEVADALELPAETVPLGPDEFLPVLETVVDITDGMVKWNTLLNLSAVFNIDGRTPDVMMEGLFGVGHGICRNQIRGPSSLVESMYKSEATLSTETVQDLLGVDVDPLGSFRKEARRTDESTFARAVVDANYQNYYARHIHASNQVPRSQVGTRVPYADGEFLSTLARMPIDYRMGTLPFSDDLVYGIAKPKLRMMRSLNADLAEIPYERSRLAPTRPFPLHVLGFYLSTAIARLRSQYTYGGPSMAGEWYRSHDGVRETLDGLIDDATSRRFFDANAVQRRREQHLSGESDELTTLASITTVELWLQQNMDGRR